MGRYIKPSVIFLLLLCITLSCDGHGSNNTTTRTIGPEGGTIRSSDGRLTLIIPAGVLDEDTEISIKRINRDELPPEFSGIDTGTQYELGPDGLEFNVPIDVEFISDQDAMGQDGDVTFDPPILLTSSNGDIEILGDLETEINDDDDSVTVKGTLEHFSVLVEVRGSITVMIENVPKVIGLNIPFTVIVSVIEIKFSSITLTDALYTDRSFEDIFPVGELDFVAEVIPFSPEDSPSIENVYKTTFDYICLGSETTSGIYGAEIVITGETSFLIEGGTLVSQFNEKIVLARSINCPLDGPPPPPPPPTMPPPPPLLEIIIDEILAQYELNCQSKQDTFQIFIGNFGESPFSFPIIIDLNNENKGLLDDRGLSMTDIIITTPEDLFTLEGQLTDLEDGTFGAEAEGSGFLGDMSPAAADIIVKAEDWIFDLDEGGNVILREGDLRFNFPELLLNSQSSVAECAGIKVEE